MGQSEEDRRRYIAETAAGFPELTEQQIRFVARLLAPALPAPGPVVEIPARKVRRVGPTDEEPYWTPAEIGELLQKDASTVRRWIEAKKLPGIDVGDGGRASYRVADRDLRAFLAARDTRK